MRNNLGKAVKFGEMRQTVQMKAIGGIEYSNCFCVYLPAGLKNSKLAGRHMARHDKVSIVGLQNFAVCDAVFGGRCERTEDTQTAIAQQLAIYSIPDFSWELLKESTARLHHRAGGSRERSTFTMASSLGGLVLIPMAVVVGS